MSYLKITAIGNLGQEPDLRYTQDGKPVCTFSVATSEKKKDRGTGEMLETTTWLRVTFFGRQAENASQYLAKGKSVYVEGRGRLETWTDRDGKVRTTLEVFGTEMQFIAPRENRDSEHDQRRNYQGDAEHDQRQRPAPAQRVAAAPASTTPLDLSDDDIPF